MKSELVSFLETKSDYLKRIIEDYKREKAEITIIEKVETEITLANRKRKKELIILIEKAENKRKEIEDYIVVVTEIEDRIKEFEKLSLTSDKNTRESQIIQEKLKFYKEEYEKLSEELKKEYDFFGERNSSFEELTSTKKGVKKVAKISVSVLALIIAGCILGKNFPMLDSFFTKNKNKNNDNVPEPAPSSNSTEFTQENPNDIEQGVTLVEENGELFVDIFDEEQVALRGQEILPYFEELAPNLKFTNNNAEKLLNCMNCGLVKEINQAQGLEQVNIFEALLNGEINYSIDLVNKGFSLRKEQNTVVDYGKFFIDGSKTQELASEMSEYRYGMMIDKENGKEYATKFTVLLMKSWLLDGCDNEVISAYRLESSSNKVFIDKLFLNTAMLAGAYDNIEVINPLDGEVITLKYLIEEINKNNCPVELIADNGDIVNTYTNKFSYDMIGMISELTYNNENKNVRSLTK